MNYDHFYNEKHMKRKNAPGYSIAGWKLEHQASLCSSPWYSGDSMTAENAGTSAFVNINTVIALMLHLDFHN